MAVTSRQTSALPQPPPWRAGRGLPAGRPPRAEGNQGRSRPPGRRLDMHAFRDFHAPHYPGRAVVKIEFLQRLAFFLGNRDEDRDTVVRVRAIIDDL